VGLGALFLGLLVFMLYYLLLFIRFLAIFIFLFSVVGRGVLRFREG